MRETSASRDEDPQTLTSNSDLIERLTRIRIQAGKLMGIGGCNGYGHTKTRSRSAGRKGRHFVCPVLHAQWYHPALATTGAVGIATAAITEGSVVFEQAGNRSVPTQICIEHPAGRLDDQLEMRNGAITAGLVGEQPADFFQKALPSLNQTLRLKTQLQTKPYWLKT